ncbi:MAG: N-methyl-L-tryptophan oxidase [Acidobacteria bacterium]|nr:N-methyl-L-tryptophan oxidase [Acidobacteriota bacterium]
MRHYDAIVIGLGAMGSAAVYHLARRGVRVLGIDARERGHAMGASHGPSRIIREAYFEGAAYVELVRRAYVLWQELEAVSGRQLLTITGGLWMGRSDSDVVAGALASAREHGLKHDLLGARDLAGRFPAFEPHPDWEGLFEWNAGILRPEECIAAHLDQAALHGAELHHGQPVLTWSGHQVECPGGIFTADRIILTAGPWTAGVTPESNLPLEVLRVFGVHVEPADADPFRSLPVFLWRSDQGNFYGFPYRAGEGLKFAAHGTGEVCHPDAARRDVTPQEIAPLLDELNRYLPGAGRQVRAVFTCLYTMTPDSHFILDRHPRHDHVWLACGFSGHGFKFSSAIGEALADLAATGSTSLPVAFLARKGRF